jgi:hypothetical protein
MDRGCWSGRLGMCPSLPHSPLGIRRSTGRAAGANTHTAVAPHSSVRPPELRTAAAHAPRPRRSCAPVVRADRRRPPAVLLASVLSRRRWVMRQARGVPGRDPGRPRRDRRPWSEVSRGYGRWVRDVLVWTKARSCFATRSWPLTARASRALRARMRSSGSAISQSSCASSSAVCDCATRRRECRVARKSDSRRLATGASDRWFESVAGRLSGSLWTNSRSSTRSVSDCSSATCSARGPGS